MQLTIVREAAGSRESELLQYTLSTPPLNDVVAEGLRRLGNRSRDPEVARRLGGTGRNDSLWVLPRPWHAGLTAALDPAVYYDDASSLDLGPWAHRCTGAWAVLANGRFAAYANPRWLSRCLDTAYADCLAVTAASELLACREKLRLTQDNRVAGYRRLYADSMSPMPVPVDWPHYLFVRREAWEAVLTSGLLSSFAEWADRCRHAGLRLQGVSIAGLAFDLESQEGMLALTKIALSPAWGPDPSTVYGRRMRHPYSREEREGISPEARLVGPVRLGKQVTVEAGAVVVGPTVLCDGCTVGRDALVDAAIVGTGASIAPGQSFGGRLLTARGDPWPVARDSDHEPRITGHEARATGHGSAPLERVWHHGNGAFRTWPRFSYARCFKRIADVVAAVVVLILFAPVIPVLALAIKISSPGPIFFRDKRQGLHGKPFFCVKFRTMRQGADKIQDKLRFVSEVDGPQFKMADDPRITTVGRFLRETYLDEIPQFFNVLCGQMSVVGPRPSPEAENTLCPWWRDARLSVRPGITGLWQVYRTREPHKDFQEWIHYDTQYVRDFSFGLDLWICWRTFQKMVRNFVQQF